MEMTVRHAHLEPLAIVGIGCRFPGGPTPEAFWTMLREGRSAVREIPEDRFSLAQFYDTDPHASGRVNTRFGGFIDNVREFDAQFFGISPREAEAMDPGGPLEELQHRRLYGCLLDRLCTDSALSPRRARSARRHRQRHVDYLEPRLPQI
jgi:hypothetical protein